MSVDRRTFLARTAAVATAFASFRSLHADPPAVPDYGALQADPQGIIDLPAGFSYQIISRQGQVMADGFKVPGMADGMAAFPGPDGLTLIVRNHENDVKGRGPFVKEVAIDPGKIYDRGAGQTPGLGGTTTLVYDTKAQALKHQFLSLAGTYRNCAGGPTPWGSWLSCEESVVQAGEYKKSKVDLDHGYVFEVPATAEPGIVDPVPLKAMGRFNHEAVAIDPDTGIIYQTEDRGDGLIYRFVPSKPGELQAGGRLEALAIKHRPGADTRNWQGQMIKTGERLQLDWLPMSDVEAPAGDDLRLRGFAAGAARFARGEGMWTGDDGIYFACTSGGPAEAGQIWRLHPGSNELELFYEATSKRICCNVDNICVTPGGDLIGCEDRSGPEVRLLWIGKDASVRPFALNHKRSEFAGACFSPDGSTLFVNIQGPGLTLAIVGPWGWQS